MDKRIKEFRKDKNKFVNHSRYFLRSSKTKLPLPGAVVGKLYDSKYTATNKRSLKISEVTFTDLPLEVKIKILSYINIKDIFMRVAPVNREWYLLSRHPSLWRFLRFEGKAMPTKEVCHLLSLAPGLRRLEITDRCDVDKLLMEVCRSNRLLEHISVNNTHMSTRLSPYAVHFSKTPAHFKWQMNESIFQDIPYFPVNSDHTSHIPSWILLRILRSCQRLVSLNLVGMEIRSHCFFKKLSNLPRLQSVDVTVAFKEGILAQEMDTLINTQLGKGTRPNPFHLHALYNWCSEGQNINSISYGRISNAYVNYISGLLYSSLVVLKLDAFNAKEDHFELLYRCVSLQVLHLDNARWITSAVVIRMITSLHHLISLRIHIGCRLRAAVFNSAFKSGMSSKDGAIKKIPLKYLGMIGCQGLDDESIHSIGLFCPELEHLSLAQCHNITDTAVKWIIRYLHNLRSLNLWNCPGIIGYFLIHIPNNIPDLKFLMIDPSTNEQPNTYSKRNIVDLMKKFHPHVTVHCSYSPPDGWTKLCNTA